MQSFILITVVLTIACLESAVGTGQPPKLPPIDCSAVLCLRPPCDNPLPAPPGSCCPVCPDPTEPPTTDICSRVRCARPPCPYPLPPPKGKCCPVCPPPTEPPTLDCRLVRCARPPCDNPRPPPKGQCCPVCPPPTEPPTLDCRLVLCALPPCDDPLPPPKGQCCPVCPPPTEPPTLDCRLVFCPRPPCPNPRPPPVGKCCQVCPEPPPKVCRFKGKVFKVGDSFPAGDGCNTCTCIAPNRVVCTEIACRPPSLICPPLPPGTVGICVELCSADDDCSEGEKCCSNGCGHVCTRAIPGPPPTQVCRFKGKVFRVGDSFPAGDGCNTCGCIAPGRVVCTLIQCRWKRGLGRSQYVVEAEPPTCPPDKPTVNCLVDPCDVTSCPAHPDAKCVSDFCGGCNARFFDEDGNEVTDTCDVVPPTCPPDKPRVNCFVDPCRFATCPAHPDAECVADYCGGCNARFFDEDGNEVTDTCSCPVKGQVFNRCGSACPPNCTTPNPICTRQCVPRCECPRGQVIDEEKNKCVPVDQCPPIQCPIEGQVFKTCGTGACAATCTNLVVACPAVCIPSCGCPTGQVIDEVNKRCVLPDKCPDPCSLPPDTGPCRALIPSFFFNSSSGQCERFTYGGCRGNNNRFSSLVACMKKCGPPCPIKGAEFQECSTCPATCTNPGLICALVCRPGCGCPPGKLIDEANKRCVDPQDCPDICKLPPDPGPCEAAIPSFFFNPKSGRCEKFIYGGCQGNQNRFGTEQECNDRCNPDGACPPLCSVEFCKKNRRAQCTIPGPREIPGCTGACSLTHCNACYFSEEPRVPDPKCTFCGAPIRSQRCLRRWAFCVQWNDWKKFGNTPHQQVTPENFKCYSYPCPLRG